MPDLFALDNKNKVHVKLIDDGVVHPKEGVSLQTRTDTWT